MSVLLNLALVLLFIGLAAWTVLTRDTFAAVAGFIPYGLLLTVVWLRLVAVDVAITEAAIGAGLTGALLVGAAARLRATEARTNRLRPGAWTRVLAAIGSVAVAGFVAVCVLLLPEATPTLAPAVMDNIHTTGVGNPITAVLLSFRAMDTLLEAIVLAFGLLGVWSLAPDLAWGGRPSLQPIAQPNSILAHFARMLPPIGIVIGVYILWYGADHPGGKFQGATILAAMWLLAMMAGLADVPRVGRFALRFWLVAGPLVFILVGFAGALTAGAFLGYPDGLAKLWIVAVEFALMPSLALTLGLLLAGAPHRALQK
ncbi:Domain related to MnhB subunit of Na+/H+ antiporter [Variovorax sp. HW608]|uniref:hydrogenase subunit MbhD domain-containing protein n=1 Tax=Variovorax sp. HW608 TaxID=1034889 RepID=UPI00081FC648|nr:hydrogenase subunit MbhD domain-containing protein [Variovorax sp. HW608]SCK43693.1 Domain related to MnhB subunit of Na+/H+ antiporter [Variovorax sp. HW608]